MGLFCLLNLKQCYRIESNRWGNSKKARGFKWNS